ncbi:hypothetical protein OPV22_025069 [Ensete ventricosum]|uniref:Glycosyl transferase CAP10 domain-containing protein n=1 Tax=Ensete ventricosum TaxID=4639 RepID=A0AAV8P991_ENSVE|nr:hypothetical protein OPV22_025069 [Ensete ventricosum]
MTLRCGGAQIMRRDWLEESRCGFQKSSLSNQCSHRYKIYAEGYAWSFAVEWGNQNPSKAEAIDREEGAGIYAGAGHGSGIRLHVPPQCGVL